MLIFVQWKACYLYHCRHLEQALGFQSISVLPPGKKKTLIFVFLPGGKTAMLAYYPQQPMLLGVGSQSKQQRCTKATVIRIIDLQIFDL